MKFLSTFLIATCLTFIVPGFATPVPFTLTPAKDGLQLVRYSFPLPSAFPTNTHYATIQTPSGTVLASVRPLTFDRSPDEGTSCTTIRRGLVTFPYTFTSRAPANFQILQPASTSPPPSDWITTLAWSPEQLTLTSSNQITLSLHPLGPIQIPDLTQPTSIEWVENSPHYQWQRRHYEMPEWKCIIETRLDLLGGLLLSLQWQSQGGDDRFTPNLGWKLTSSQLSSQLPSHLNQQPIPAPLTQPITHEFNTGTPLSTRLNDGYFQISLPNAHLKKRGSLSIQPTSKTAYTWTYLRATESEEIPLQPFAWRSAEIFLAPSSLAPVSPVLTTPHLIHFPEQNLLHLYRIEPDLPLNNQPTLAAIRHFHRQSILESALTGDDWGNVTGYSGPNLPASTFGMNRLNHATPIFEEAWRSQDPALLQTALAWVDNFHNLSIWWGPERFGGTRYNNLAAMGKKPPTDTFMWRSNSSVDFCTKGYDALFLAYEETGDPRHFHATQAQIDYAAEHLHVDRGECRNIGDVRDFIKLYEWTHEPSHLHHATRLFLELESKLMPNHLFSQSGHPILDTLPFIDDDHTGYRNPFAKPYIIGYALSGLPSLAPLTPQHPRIHSVVQAVAHFLSTSMDPLGGWRYPHPRSSSLLLSQAMEHAWQITQAAQNQPPSEEMLDAIEAVLRQRLHGWIHSGTIFNGIQPWEKATRMIPLTGSISAFYTQPEARDFTRDYSEGRASFGGTAIEGLVYFTPVLNFYLAHRPAEKLLAPADSDQSPLGIVMKTSHQNGVLNPSQMIHSAYQTPGITNKLPTFLPSLKSDNPFPLSWLSGTFTDFETWKATASQTYRNALLLTPPPSPFQPVIIDQVDRGNFWTRKIVLQLTAHSRVLALITVPKGDGPFPAVLLLHDHGARFDIGKEKVIRPFNVSEAIQTSAQEWVDKLYGGVFLGDTLADQGYLCLAVDALNWSDRGGAGYEGQQELASNLLHFGMSWAGLIAHEDLRAAEFLATYPQVDPTRVAAMGLSMGGFRTWQVNALSPHIKAGLSICWMTTRDSVMSPGNNQTRGQSAFTMTHPGLLHLLDYPDLAALACPKPLLVYNGSQDKLFPVEGVEIAHTKLKAIYDSQGQSNALETKIWNEPHVFSRPMQTQAFKWLKTIQSPRNSSSK